MGTITDRNHEDIIRDMDESQALNHVILAVREAIEDTRRTRKRVNRTLELMEARHFSGF
jgi:hypothetical protein